MDLFLLGFGGTNIKKGYSAAPASLITCLLIADLQNATVCYALHAEYSIE